MLFTYMSEWIIKQAGTVTQQFAQGGLYLNFQQNALYRYSTQNTPVQGNE